MRKRVCEEAAPNNLDSERQWQVESGSDSWKDKEGCQQPEAEEHNESKELKEEVEMGKETATVLRNGLPARPLQ